MKYPNRTQLNSCLLPLAIVTVTISLFLKAGEWSDYAVRCVALLSLVALIVVNYIWNLLYLVVQRHKSSPKPACPYYTSEQCPHADKRDCRYDTTVCHINNSKSKTKRGIGLTLLLLLCMIVSVLAELVMENEGLLSFVDQNYDFKTILKILQPVSNSLIAAVVVYFLIDIPGRLREYQDFFVDLLSSDKYLKLMQEKQLTKLREKITWQLHVKDFPNMPRGLITIDERFCEMLRQPYFKIYSQTTTVSRPDANSEMLRKKVAVKYIAYNPHAAEKPVLFDIGLANSLKFNEEAITESAQTLFKLNSFSISFDGDEREYNMLPYLRIGVTKEKKDGFLYNGRILLIPHDDYSNEKEPFEKAIIEKGANSTEEGMSYVMIEDSSIAGLFVTIKDNIRVKFEYEVSVPKDDISYTKRLRYPVKYFSLNYSLDETITDMTVVGQIIGTLINQPDITAEMSDNKKRIILKTQNWLLPKNGAMVVHCKA